MQGLFLVIIFIRASLDYFANKKLLGLNPSSYLALLIIAIFLLELLTKRKAKIKSGNKLFKCFFVYLFLLVPSVIISDDWGDSLAELMRYTSELGCIYLTYKYCVFNELYIRKLIKSILGSSIIPLLVGTYQILTKGGVYDRQVGGYRILSVFVHENQYGIYLVAIISLCLYIILSKEYYESKWFRRGVYVVLFGGLINLLFTYSRTNWIWLAIILFGIAIYNIKKKSILLLIGFGLVFSYYASDLILTRFFDVSKAGDGGSLTIRQKIVSTMLRYALQKPIFGHGLGNFSVGTGMYMGREIEAHNEYVKTFFDSGLLGVIGLFYYFYNLLMIFIKNGIKKNYLAIFFLLGFFISCYFTNTLSCLVGQIYILTFLTILMVKNINNQINQGR